MASGYDPVIMTNRKFRILWTILALTLAACSSAPKNEPETSTSTPTMANSNTQPAEAPKPPAPEPPRMLAVPAGTALHVVLNTELSSSKSNAGDKFEASLTAPVVVDGVPILERGSKVHGRVVDAKE